MKLFNIFKKQIDDDEFYEDKPKEKVVLTNKELQDKIEDLEKKLFKKEDNHSFFPFVDWTWGFSTYEPLTLEEKIDALAKYLKVDFERKVRDEVVAKVIKTKKRK